MRAYVNFVEQSGAQVVPLLHNESKESLDYKLAHIDGILFPGGDGNYIETATYILDKVIEINQNGGYMPLWGTCLGFEAILNITDNKILDHIPIYHKSINIHFTTDTRKTQMYSLFE